MVQFIRLLLAGTIGVSLLLLVSPKLSGIESLSNERVLRSLNGKWYNKSTQEYIPPTVVSEFDNKIRREGWEAKPTKKWDWDWWDWGWSSAAVGEVMSYVILTVLCLLLLTGIAMLILHALRNYLPELREQKIQAGKIQIDAARVADLPFEVTYSSGDPLEEARKLFEAGQYDAAIVYLYGYQLLALDQARRIHLQKGKTNRMYLREVGEFLQLKSICEATMLAFESVYFGKHSIGRDAFLELWNQLELFHQCLIVPAANVPPNSDHPVVAIPS